MTKSKKESDNRWVMMYLSWPVLPAASMNRGMPKYNYLNVPKKMHLP